jgi:hypothetical protein
MAGTVSLSDLYGNKTPGREAGNNELQPIAAASGSVPTSGKTPAMFWVGMVAMLVIIRVLWEKGK